MLSERERELFEDLERRFYRDEPLPRPAQSEAAGRFPAGRAEAPRRPGLLSAVTGVCVAAIAISGLLGSPEAVLSFSGVVGMLGFLHYHL